MDEMMEDDDRIVTHARQTVRFASTNKMREFDSDMAVLTLLQENNESCVDIQIHDGKQKKLSPRRVVERKSLTKRLTPKPLNNDNINADSTDEDINGCVGGRELVRSKGASASYPHCNDNLMVAQTQSLHPSTKIKKKKAVQIALLHSHSHTQILHEAMEYIHQDRDILLESLLKWCGIINGAQRGGSLSSFLTILSPRMGTRDLLEKFHSSEYLNLLEYPDPKVDGTLSFQSSNVIPSEVTDSPLEVESYMQYNRPSDEILSQHGLEDDCPYPTSPTSHALLWKYCLAITGASCHAASLLTSASDSNPDVAIHWGGGRHHAHTSKASGFCYVSDVILAIQRLLNNGHDRILYIDIDIHHADAVQNAFYDTNRVLTVSFHRYAPGFFPTTSGSNSEKGKKVGFGYNLNLPLPAGVNDVQFVQIYREALFGLVNARDPHAVVLCVGADGLEGDALISGGHGGDSVTPGEGWALSPEGLAECVRLTAANCAGMNEESVPPINATQEEKVGPDNYVQIVKLDTPSGKRRKLLLLGGGGYTPAQTARTQLLCTAAACEGARPGMFWSELPRDIPCHEYFPRYGPLFELVSEQRKAEIYSSYSSSKGKSTEDYERCIMPDCDRQILRDASRSIALSVLYLDHQRKKQTPEENRTFCYDQDLEKDHGIDIRQKKSTNSGGGRRRKKIKIETSTLA